MPAPSQTGGRRCTKGSGSRLLKLESGTRLCPKEEQKGAISAAICLARGAGYFAIREPRYALPTLTLAMDWCMPGECEHAHARVAIAGKDAHRAHDL